MKITKIGHCCLLIEIEGRRILTDPGSFTVEGLVTENIDIVLITHEHADHLHIESLKKIVEVNSGVQIFSNSSVGKLLTEVGVAFNLLEGSGTTSSCGIDLEAFDGKHEEIYKDIGQVQNTGYFVAGKLFYPGDSYIVPGKHVEVLAFPLGGPWCKVAEAVRYVLSVKPKHAIPVHDGIEREDRVGILHRVPAALFPQNGIDFRPMKAGDSQIF